MEDASDGCSPLYIMTKCARKKVYFFCFYRKNQSTQSRNKTKTCKPVIGINLKTDNLNQETTWLLNVSTYASIRQFSYRLFTEFTSLYQFCYKSVPNPLHACTASDTCQPPLATPWQERIEN